MHFDAKMSRYSFVLYSMCCDRKGGRVAEGGQEVRHTGKDTDIGKGTDKKSFPEETKSHMVSHVVGLALVFSIFCTSQNQLTTNTKIPLQYILVY